MSRRNDNSEWVIWITIFLVAAYMATQYIGPLSGVVIQPPSPSQSEPPQPKPRRWFPIFPSRPLGLNHATHE